MKLLICVMLIIASVEAQIITGGGGTGGGTVGPGTINRVPIFSTTTTVGDSNLAQDGTTGQLTASKSLNGPAPAAPVFSATPTIDLALGNRFEMPTMTANVTAVTFTHPKAGLKFSMVWPQGASAFTLTYGGGISACQLLPDATAVLIQNFEVSADGTTIQPVDCSLVGVTNLVSFGPGGAAATVTPASPNIDCRSITAAGLDCLNSAGIHTGTVLYTGVLATLDTVNGNLNWAGLHTNNASDNGTKYTFGSNATTAGAGLTCNTPIPTTPVGGDLFCNAAGVLGFNDGTNSNAVVTFGGAGNVFSANPTVGHIMTWAANYKAVDGGVVPTGNAPGGSGTELQYRGGATTFNALANSSVPNAGEVLVTTTPSATATRSIFGLGSAPTNCPTAATSGCYYSINSAAAFAGDYFRAERNGVDSIVLRTDSSGFQYISLGSRTSSGVQLWHFTASQLNLLDGAGSTGNTRLTASSLGALTSGGTSKVSINGNAAGPNNIETYSGVSTVGYGVPAIYGTGRSAAQTAAVATVATYTNGAADGSFVVSANVNVTASTTHSFTTTVTYTDETNTSRVLTLNYSQLTGTLLTAITNVQGVGAYEGVPLHIRCKASTAITIATTGTFTSVTYNVEGFITQIG